MENKQDQDEAVALFDGWINNCLHDTSSSHNDINDIERLPIEDSPSQDPKANLIKQCDLLQITSLTYFSASSQQNELSMLVSTLQKSVFLVPSTDELLESDITTATSTDDASENVALRGLHLLLGAIRGGISNNGMSIEDTNTKSNHFLSQKLQKSLTDYCVSLLKNHRNSKNRTDTTGSAVHIGTPYTVPNASSLILCELISVPLLRPIEYSAASQRILQAQHQETIDDQRSTISDLSSVTFTAFDAPISISKRVDLLDLLSNIVSRAMERLELSQHIVKITIGSDDSEEEDEMSSLPRAGRSLCFELLNSAIKSVRSSKESTGMVETVNILLTELGYHHNHHNGDADNNEDEISQQEDVGDIPHIQHTKLMDSIQTFAKFTSGCLIGETDPRCLLQMLTLLHDCQLGLDGLLSNCREKEEEIMSFPYVEFFDSVAPYYPIVFTPPPNDVHRITRNDLHNALLSVLCHYLPSINNRDNDGMMALSCRLFMERLNEPLDDGEEGGGEENITKDKIDALNDLIQLFRFQTNSSNRVASFSWDDVKSSTIITNGILLKSCLDETLVQEISDTLIMLHNEHQPLAIEDVESGILVFRIRSFAGWILSALEQEPPQQQQFANRGKRQVNKNKTELKPPPPPPTSSLLVKSFLSTPKLHSLTKTIAATPESSLGRSATAYISRLLQCCSHAHDSLHTCLELSACHDLAGFVIQYHQQQQIQKHQHEHEHKENCQSGGCGSKKRSNNGGPTLMASLYAMAAIFSSCKPCLTHCAKMGIAVYPHPLSDIVTQELCTALIYLARLMPPPSTVTAKTHCQNDNTMDTDAENHAESDHGEENEELYAIAASAVSALEALLWVFPPTVIVNVDADADAIATTSTIQLLSKSWDQLLESVIVTKQIPMINNQSNDISEKEGKRRWKQACANSIGSLIAYAVTETTISNHDSSSTKSTVINDITPSSKIVSEFLPKLLLSATTKSSSNSTHQQRYDWVALARGCRASPTSSSLSASDLVVPKLAKYVLECVLQYFPSSNTTSEINQSGQDAATATQALTFILLYQGNDYARNVWKTHVYCHQVVSLQLITCLLPDNKNSNDTNLHLPESNGSLEAKDAVKSASKILPPLLPLYREKDCISIHLVRQLIIQYITPIVPPLSETEHAKLSIMLPILASILSSGVLANQNNVTKDFSNNEKNVLPPRTSLATMALSLCEYVLCDDNPKESRSAASSCVFSLVLYDCDDGNDVMKDDDDEEEPHIPLAQLLWTKCISPVILDAINDMKEHAAANIDSDDDSRLFTDSISLAAVVGSAASCNGGPSAPVADKIISFFTELCCSCYHDDNDGDVIMPDLITENTNRINSYISVLAGEAFGSLLAVEGGGPFWKQRAAFMSLPKLLFACRVNDSSQETNGTTTNSVRNSQSGYSTETQPRHSKIPSTHGTGLSLGPAIAISHFVCCVSIQALGSKKSLVQLINAVVHILSFFYDDTRNDQYILLAGTKANVNRSSGIKNENHIMKITTTSLAALLKLLSLASKELFVPYLLPSSTSLLNKGDSNHPSSSSNLDLTNYPQVPNILLNILSAHVRSRSKNNQLAKKKGTQINASIALPQNIPADGNDDESKSVLRHLFALQCLELLIVRFGNDNDNGKKNADDSNDAQSMETEGWYNTNATYQSRVLNTLKSSVNHPSILIRRAAVQVRNLWSTAVASNDSSS